MIILGAFFKCSLNSSLEHRDGEVTFSAAVCQSEPDGRRLRKIPRMSCDKSVPYVSPPSPMEVKKLMAKRVFLGLSRGKRPSKNGCRVLNTGDEKHSEFKSVDVSLSGEHQMVYRDQGSNDYRKKTQKIR